MKTIVQLEMGNKQKSMANDTVVQYQKVAPKEKKNGCFMVIQLFGRF